MPGGKFGQGYYVIWGDHGFMPSGDPMWLSNKADAISAAVEEIEFFAESAWQAQPDDPNFGEVDGLAYQTPEGIVWMWRKGQRVRFYTADARQVGSEQANVAPAVAYAHNKGWEEVDPLSPNQIVDAVADAKRDIRKDLYAELDRNIFGVQYMEIVDAEEAPEDEG